MSTPTHTTASGLITPRAKSVPMVKFIKDYKVMATGNVRTPARIGARAAAAGWKEYISKIGGYRSNGGGYCDHPSGQAIDIMKKGGCNDANVDEFWEMANFFRKWADEYLINYMIFRQQMWRIYQPSWGWKDMGGRGDCNANHMNHIHISFVGGPCAVGGGGYTHKTGVKTLKRPIPPPVAARKFSPDYITLLGKDSQGSTLKDKDKPDATPKEKDKLVVSGLPSGKFTMVMMRNEKLGEPLQLGAGLDDDASDA